MRHPVALTVTLFSLALVWCVCALALDPSLDVSQYAHTSWKDSNGFSGGLISSITQTPDGYLWLGTEFGLLRFDGAQAVPWRPPANQHLPSIAIESLRVGRDGTLWIGTWKGLASWKDGRLTQYPELAGLVIMGLVEESDGTIWAGGFASNGPGKLCAIQNGTAHCYGEDGTLGKGPVGLYEDGQGNLWVGVLDGLWRWKPGPAHFYPVAGETLGVQGIVQGRDGKLLISLRGRVAELVAGKPSEVYPYPEAARTFLARGLLRDRDGSLWIGTRGAGIVHMHPGTTDEFAQSDGLSNDNVTAFFEDREGSIWVATSTGLDRFRAFPVVTFSAKQGFASETYGSVLTASDGSVWQGAPAGLRRWDHGQLTIYHGSSAKVAMRQPGTTSREVALHGLPKYEFVSLSERDRGRIWVVTDGGAGYLEDDRFIRINAVAGGVAYSVAGAANGDLWIANWARGLLHVRGDNLVQTIPWSAFGRQDFAAALTFDPLKGGIWLGFSKGGLAYFSEGQIRASYTPADGLGEGRVGDLRFDHDGALWAATEGGLSRVKDGRIDTLTGKNGLPCDIVHWAIEDDDHSFWLYMPCGLVRIARSELDAWISDPNRKIQITLFNSSDGLTMRGDTPSVSPSVAKSLDGRLWFTTYRGLSVVDPQHLTFNKLPPPVHIEQVTADGKAYDPAQGLRLPARVQNIDVDYTALSLVAPEKNRFRFKLEGYDRDWRDVGNRRQAFYTNLPPRNYRFRVMASNNSGVWNETGASLDFSVLPAFYQTNWFRVLCAVGFLALLWGIYQLRVQQLKQQFNIGLEARVNERTRIARELHDTLLQNFHGLMFQFQAARNLMARRPEEAMRSLDEAINETKKAIAQSRDAIQGLRSEPMAKGNLAELLTATSRQFADSNANEHSPVFDLIEEGERQTLSSTVSDEICRIALELMRNAFEHAHAQRIEVEIRYGDSTMRLRIRDDGKGIDPKVLKEGGRSGHWGLRGVRERADRIGASLDVWSEPGGGTEVQLLVPAEIAYENLPDSYRAKLVRKVKSRV